MLMTAAEMAAVYAAQLKLCHSWLVGSATADSGGSAQKQQSVICMQQLAEQSVQLLFAPLDC